MFPRTVVIRRARGRQAVAIRLVRTLHRSGFSPAEIAGLAHLSGVQVEQILLQIAPELRRVVAHRDRAYWGQHHEDEGGDYQLALDLDQFN